MQFDNEWMIHACKNSSLGLRIFNLLELDELLLLQRLHGEHLPLIMSSLLSDEDNLAVCALSQDRYHFKIVF